MTKNNLILSTDSYKFTQWFQYPEGTTDVFSYIESRGGQDEVMFFGLLKYIKQHLLRRITAEDVECAKLFVDAHIGPGVFNYDGWMSVVNDCDGKLPIRIRALKEGMVVPTKTALVTVQNTKKGYGWLTSYLETGALRDVWYGCTIASLSLRCKRIIKAFLEKTSDDVDGALGYAVHDFGYRGVSSDESAAMGSAAHLVNFMGTDTVAGLIAAIEFYNAVGPVGFSVVASEHSTMCANADADNKDDFASAERMVSILEQRVKATGQFQIVAAVADTYDVYRFARDYIGGRLKDRIVNSGGRLVVRPDSGDPTVVPIEIIEILLEKFGYTVNSKGYKVLPPCIRVLQGDGVNEHSIKIILEKLESKGISTENIVLGMGGALLQHSNRDDLKFAMKASAICVNDQWKDVFKDPITDRGKKSKKGRLTTVRTAGDEIVTKRIEDVTIGDMDLMQTVYEDGELLIDDNFDAIRQRARTFV